MEILQITETKQKSICLLFLTVEMAMVLSALGLLVVEDESKRQN